MHLELDGKIALITGSTKGIGFAIAKALHAEGCKVVLNGRNNEDIITATQKLEGSCGFRADVTQPEEAEYLIERTINAFGHLDILICNVGSGKSVAPGEETAEEWHRVFSKNLWSTTNIVEAARWSLEKRKGSIVCISSICGIEVIPNAPITYSAAKAALHAYVKGVSRPLGKKGIRINAVAPGNIMFEGSTWSKKVVDNGDVIQTMLDREVSLSRFGSTEEVANLVVFLASSRTAFGTGGIWTLDGGQIRS